MSVLKGPACAASFPLPSPHCEHIVPTTDSPPITPGCAPAQSWCSDGEETDRSIIHHLGPPVVLCLGCFHNLWNPGRLPLKRTSDHYFTAQSNCVLDSNCSCDFWQGEHGALPWLAGLEEVGKLGWACICDIVPYQKLTCYCNFFFLPLAETFSLFGQGTNTISLVTKTDLLDSRARWTSHYRLSEW